MTHSICRTAIVSAVLLALGGTGAVWAQTAPQDQGRTDALAASANQWSDDSDQPVADTWITTKVKTELAMTDGVKSMGVSVETSNGVVTLTGTQPSEVAVQKAVSAAQSIKGVRQVDAAGLKVDSDQAANESDRSSSAGEAVSDGWITTKVKAELAMTDGVRSSDVSVSTRDGVVTLTGVLDSDSAVGKAEAVAQSVRGVHEVDSSGLKARS